MSAESQPDLEARLRVIAAALNGSGDAHTLEIVELARDLTPEEILTVRRMMAGDEPVTAGFEGVLLEDEGEEP